MNLNYFDKGIIHKKKLDSTSSFLKRNYSSYENYTIVRADFQTSGHGRMGRSWESKSSENLMFSILIKDEILINKFSSLSLASAKVVFDALNEYSIQNAKIKWPNDVYVNDKKICGILLEGISNNDKLECLIIGIGINVNQIEFDNQNATSIKKELNKNINLDDFANSVFKLLLEELNNIKNDTSNYLTVIRNNNYLKNKEAYAEIDNEKVLVSIIDINDDNSIKIVYNNKEYNLSTGEISFHKE